MAITDIFDKGLDYTTLIKTDDFKRYVYSLPSSVSFNHAVEGLVLDLIGDLAEIKIYGKNEMALFIMYDLNYNTPSYARVEVQSEKLKSMIRQEIRTNTGIKLRVECLSSGVNVFRLVEIIEYNKSCKYGQWICSECGYNYKFEDPEGYGCCICGGKVEQIFDFYS